MNTILKGLACLAVTAAANGLLGATAVSAGASAPAASGAGIGTGATSTGNGGVTGTVNGNRNPARRDPELQQPSTSRPVDNGSTDTLQQQRQQSGEQMIQERKGQSGDTR